MASGYCGAVQRGCQGEEKKAGAVRALSLCTARLEIMELTIIIIIITTVDSPVLNHVRGQNFSCCSYSTLSLTYIHYLPTFHVEFDDDSLPHPPTLHHHPPTHNQRTRVTYPSGVFDLPIHSFIHSVMQELT